MTAAEEIRDIIRKTIKSVDPNSINLNDRLIDHGIDSLDIFNILFELEEKFEIKVTDEEIKNLISLQDFADLLNNKK